MEQEAKSVPISVAPRAIIDLAVLAASGATAWVQFLKTDKSYEVLFLLIAGLSLYAYARALHNQIMKLDGIIGDMEREHRSDMRSFGQKYEDLMQRHERFTHVSNATIANLFSDVSAFAGERAIGSLTVDQESGAMVYIKATTPAPPHGLERRASMKDG